MTLFLQRIIRRGRPFYKNFLCMHFYRLLSSGCFHNFAGHHNRCSHTDFGNIPEVFYFTAINNLERLKKGSVIHHKESEIFRIPVASDPSAHCYFFVLILFFFSE